MTGPTYRLSLGGWLAYRVTPWALLRCWRGLRWLCRRPRRLGVALGVLAALWLWVLLGRWAAPALALAAGLGVSLALAAGWRPGRAGLAPARSAWRMATYRRAWERATTSAGLASGDALPMLCEVVAEGEVDVLRVRMLPGQVVEDWTKVAPRLAQTLGVRELRIRSMRGRVHELELRALRRDSLQAVVPVPAVAGLVDLTAVPVGAREDGAPLTLPLLYSHVLVGGETGSGKGSVLWSLLAAVAPGVRDGLVRVLAVDPKGGMELGVGAPLFARFAYAGAKEAAELLEEAVGAMRTRAEALRAHGQRKLLPPGEHPLLPATGGLPAREPLTVSPAYPLAVILVDELATLTLSSYVNDPKLRRRIGDALAVLLAQGRAVGISVVAATQLVQKETVDLRDLFPVRVALRAAEDEAADMLLGRGARARGALTDRIDPRTPGVCYVRVDGFPEPVRARLAYVDDEAIGRLAEAHGRARLTSVPTAAAS